MWLATAVLLAMLVRNRTIREPGEAVDLLKQSLN